MAPENRPDIPVKPAVALLTRLEAEHAPVVTTPTHFPIFVDELQRASLAMSNRVSAKTACPTTVKEIRGRASGTGRLHARTSAPPRATGAGAPLHAPRGRVTVNCPRCGVCVEMVPWAETGSWFTRDFEQTVAYLAQHAAKSVVVEMMRIAWTTVGAIIQRVVDRLGPIFVLGLQRPAVLLVSVSENDSVISGHRIEGERGHGRLSPGGQHKRHATPLL